MNKIYLKLDKKPRTIKSLLNSLYSERNDHSVMATNTYSDKQCTVLQCQSYRQRSFDDIKILVKTYFPKTSPKVILKNLILLDPKTKNGTCTGFVFSNCSTIDRIKINYNYVGSNDRKDYYFKNCNFDISKYDSEYSWRELFAMLNIHGIQDLIEYSKKHLKY